MKKSKSLVIFAIMQMLYAEDKTPFTGVYAGGSLGGFLQKGSFDFSDGANQGTLATKKMGMTAGGLAGYMKLSDNKAWFAGEVYFNLRIGKNSQRMQAGTTNLGDVTIQGKPAFGGAILMGAATNPKLIVYAKAAFELSSYSFSFSGLTGGTSTTYTCKQKITNVVPTAGALYRFSDSMLIGLEGGYVISTKKINLQFAPYTMSLNPNEYRAAITIRYVF